jgi:hypothetical protein
VWRAVLEMEEVIMGLLWRCRRLGVGYAHKTLDLWSSKCCVPVTGKYIP